ncbi:MAG: hypothetical protein ACKO2B_04640 [Betaproteobacteria bacterium]
MNPPLSQNMPLDFSRRRHRRHIYVLNLFGVLVSRHNSDIGYWCMFEKAVFNFI